MSHTLAPIVQIKHVPKSTQTLLDLARALADFMEGEAHGGNIENCGYADRLQITLTLRQMVMARREEIKCASL